MRQAGVQRGQTGLSSSQKAHTPFLPSQCQRRRQQVPQAVPIPEIASIASTVQTFVDTIASAAPEPLQPAVQVIGGDIASVAALSPTMPGLLRLTVSGVTPWSTSCNSYRWMSSRPFSTRTHLHFASVGLDPIACFVWQGLYYLLGTAPNPMLGALDFYVAAPLGNLFKKNFDAKNFALREK